MSLRLYNTRSRAVEPFAPREPARVRMYVCGLTPSAEAHLGHARSFLFFDVLRRYLVHLGYRVTYVLNVTDIDDRSIATANAEGTTYDAVIARHLANFKRSMDRLHVLESDHEPHATAYIGEIVAMIAALIERGHAYVARDGVYYAVASFPRYGALARRDTNDLLVGARIAPGEDKRDPLDFALWKFAKPGEPAWATPWGDGRPGWHIECSAMCHALLGEPLDIHGGGFDLVFPHHENEIAQSEPLFGKPLAKWWVHGGLLLFDGNKMSKSLGNFEPLSTLLDRHDPQAIRLLFLQAGYRKPLNFTEASIDGATSGLLRLQGAYDALRAAPPPNAVERQPVVGSAGPVRHAVDESASATQCGADDQRPVSPLSEAVDSYRRRFFEALDDDMNTAAAVAVLFELAANVEGVLREAHAGSMAAAFFHEAFSLIGLSPTERARRTVRLSDTITFSEHVNALVRPVHEVRDDVPTARDEGSIERRSAEASADGASRDRIPEEELGARLGAEFVSRLQADLGDVVRFNGALTAAEAIGAVIGARNTARKAKDFALADRLRKALAEHGVTLSDSREGVTWNVGG